VLRANSEVFGIFIQHKDRIHYIKYIGMIGGEVCLCSCFSRLLFHIRPNKISGDLKLWKKIVCIKFDLCLFQGL
jgi:hypothetical protein